MAPIDNNTKSTEHSVNPHQVFTDAKENSNSTLPIHTTRKVASNLFDQLTAESALGPLYVFSFQYMKHNSVILYQKALLLVNMEFRFTQTIRYVFLITDIDILKAMYIASKNKEQLSLLILIEAR
jgi:hypothetical protein